MKKLVIFVIAMFMLYPHLLVEASSSYPDVNDYIVSKKLSAVKVEYNHKSFPTFTYRYGKGMVEGVVVHETGNDHSTILSEISYMSKNYNNAFVHAFVDGSHVIEIHSPDYGAWGAGRYANQRFVHVELVRVHSFDDFARSVNNDASYIASILYHYDLPVISAEKDGNGTLWSHFAVTKFLGGTTHGDPHGYFSKWGYSWDKFVKLVTSKYNQLPDKEDETSKLGKIQNQKVTVYPTIGNQATTLAANTVSTDTVYFIKKVSISQGQLYYLLNSEKGVIGWVKAADVTTMPSTLVDNQTKMLLIKGTGSAFSSEWGGKRDIIIANLSSYKNQFFKVQLTEKIGTTIWYRGVLNGRTLWLSSNDVSTIKVNSVSLLGHLRSSNGKIYQSIGDASTAITAGSKYAGTVYDIKKQAVVGNQIYSLLSNEKGVIGWVNSSDLVTLPYSSIDLKTNMFLIKGTGSAYSKGWGGTMDTVFANLVEYKDQGFQANAAKKIGTTMWYFGGIGAKKVWLSSNNLNVIKESATSRLGYVKNTTVRIYKMIGNNTSSLTAGSTYTGTVYYIKKQAVVNGQTYYLLSRQSSGVTGVIGWVNVSGLTTQSLITVNRQSKKLVLKGSGVAYNKPWGGKKDIITMKLSVYKGKTLKVISTEKVGGSFWYCGTLAGKTVWINKTNLK